ncbi:MAG: B12-binding domain-containing radical SAM protein, partial [Candidatus Omnitrophica bacterium]|nr:B12-binding domain-containing radical SAM protein [Candidatus Omnitrophota bacterium]
MEKKAYLLYINEETDSSLDYSGLLPTNLLKTVPKLGLQYLHAVLKQHNFPVTLLDQEIEDLSLDSLISSFKDSPPLFVGIYSSERIQSATIKFIKQLRKTQKDLIIVVGGPDYFSYEDYLTSGCTFVCHGEGEKTIVEIAEYAKGERIFQSLKGISYVKDSAITLSAPQTPISNLDDLPFPTHDNILKYADFHYPGMKKPYVHMMTSRGCGYTCSYCSSPFMWGKGVRRRSIDNILAEIDYLVEKYNVHYISFKDDRFFPDLGWLHKFCNKLSERKYDLRFNCSACPSDFNENGKEKIDLLKKAGCDALIFGLQSTNKEILKQIHRNPNEVDILRPIIEYANKVKLFTVLEFIFGLPGDTVSSLENNIKYGLQVKPYFIQFNRLMVLKSSELHALRDKEQPICDLSTKQIRKIVLKGYLRFYLHPKIFIKNIDYILKNNPHWIIDAKMIWKYPFII